MKSLVAIMFLALTIISCKDDEEKFSTAEGTWGYTTPDGKIEIQFDIAKDGSTWVVKNQMLHIEDKTYNSVVTALEVNPPTISQIRINANDAAAVYAYYISLENATVSSDFKQINAVDAFYTWPHNKVNKIKDAVITRK